MDLSSLREMMHGTARVQIALARMDGHAIDKKCCRFNDIVETAVQYGLLGGSFKEGAAWAGLREALDACMLGDPMHTGEVLVVPGWMRHVQLDA